jgi:hypothetical protein
METNKSNSDLLILKYPWLKQLFLKPASLLLVLWGWAQFANYLRFFLVRMVMLSYTTDKILEILTNGFVLLALVYTIGYLWFNRALLRNTLTKNLLIVWASWIVSMILANLIQFSVMKKIVFELQHAIFMLLTSVSIIFTGILLHNRSIKLGAIAFALLALAASYFDLKYQMLFEAIGWLVAIAIPGHLMLASSSKRN